MASLCSQQPPPLPAHGTPQQMYGYFDKAFSFNPSMQISATTTAHNNDCSLITSNNNNLQPLPIFNTNLKNIATSTLAAKTWTAIWQLQINITTNSM